MPLCRGAVIEMEHQCFAWEGIDAFDPFQEDSLIELCKAEHLGGKVV